MKKYYINEEYRSWASSMAYDIAINVIDLLNSGEYEDLDDAIRDELDTALIYYEDQWQMLRIYCTPQNCNFDDAYEELCQDIYNLIEEDICSIVEEEED